MLNIDNSILFVIDIQEKLVKAAMDGDKIASNVSKLVASAKLLGINTIITEQYPKGLGETVKLVKECVSEEKSCLFEKVSFSALEEISILETIDYLKKHGRNQVIVCGIETHICTLQTVEALIKMGFEVFVVKDASSSRNIENHSAGIEIMKQLGAYIVTTEIVLFDLLKTSKHPNFKEIQNLIK